MKKFCCLNTLAFSVAAVLCFSSCSNNEKNDVYSSNEKQKDSIEIVTLVDSFYNRKADFDTSFFSKEMGKLLMDVNKVEEEDTKRVKNSDSPTDKPYILDQNPFTAMIEGDSIHKILSVISQEKNSAKVAVDLVNFGTHWTDTVILLKHGGWRIDNFMFDTAIAKGNSKENLKSFVEYYYKNIKK